ncbi:hem peroxidase [Dillenia turbinata]|uniref:Peroxidase n=1 Tax=Dillenia turbinata TaxID=194707 RepID=A0AAN8YVC3_9MAGN
MVHKPVSYFTIALFSLIFFLPSLLHGQPSLFYGQLDYRFYDRLCPNLPMVVRYNVWQAYKNDSRIAASLLRLHFHDCIVDGCEGSVLLDDTLDFKGEKNAPPNRNSARGFEVIDSIKADLERFCPSTVSCADILALAAREAVGLAGGPYWAVPLGRRDGLAASEQAVLDQLPSPIEPLENITAKFVSKGLDIKDVVVLSGSHEYRYSWDATTRKTTVITRRSHTVGFAQCFTFSRRLFNFKNSGNPDPALNPSFLSDLQNACPGGGSTSKLMPLDSVTTYKFDNVYYKNLMNNTGLLESDQALMTDSRMAALVNFYSMNPMAFSYDFAASMAKLGNVGVLTGQAGEIRRRCGSVN